ncbi:hypothetical protein B0I37DRAFT_396332 [Chaetomium sp. MPI-CAGE-AT-0009]|nr:hypothetical protein B0I37DRAFT_396332 [Chaetomium sp. MPI-CAGE-AT-0009]
MQKKQGRSPSGHLSRLKPVELDPLAEYGLPSKGERRLLSPKIEATTTAPATTTTTTTTTTTKDETLSQLLSALRKLREGLVASRRRDHFAAQAYLFSVRLGVLAGAYETYHPAGLHLLRQHTDTPPPAEGGGGGVGSGGVGGVGNVGGGAGGGSLTSVELHEVVAYLVLDAACRRGDLAGAYALRNRYRLCDAKVDAVLRALVADNWVVWRRVKAQVDGYRAKLMEFAEAGVTGHTLKAFGRAYLAVPVGVLEQQAGRDWDELKGSFGVGWELEGERVVIRKVQGR